ncbi:MAG: glutathione peroxidase [Alphaproteobacteria bacterium PA1]|nr:MAG: glutathione peroxidase [Alphaproteobacteria bacterium PA1]
MKKLILGVSAAFGAALVIAVAATGQSAPQKPKAVPTATKATAMSSPEMFDGLMGGNVNLADYRGKVVLVVNTASQCGYTGQYAGLEALWKSRQREGLVIVGVPSNDFGGQEPGSATEIKKFCELNYGVTFPMAAKYVVRGPSAHPFYRNALSVLGPKAEPKWNFHKILIGKDGRPVAAFASAVTPQSAELGQAITNALAVPKR